MQCKNTNIHTHTSCDTETDIEIC